MTHHVKPLPRPIVLFGLLAVALAAGALQVATAAAAGEEHRYLPDLSRIYSIAEAEEEPCGIAFDSAGNRYVSAREMFTVQVYDPAGELITEFEPEGNFGEPCDLAVDASGAVYVGDIEMMVVKYVPAEPLGDGSGFEIDEDAGDEGVIVEEGAFAIAVNPADQHLFVGEGDKISEYDSDGGLAGETGDAVPGASWQGLDIYGATGDLYAIDAQSDQVYVLDGTDGSVQATVTGAANPSFPGGFGNLGSAGLAVDQQNGDFYVNDTMENEVVAEFTATGSFVSQIGPWLGEGEVKLQKVANTQAVEVDNGSASPNKGDVFALAMWSNLPLELSLGLYAFAGELTPTPMPAVANADPTAIAKTGATLKGSVDNEGAQSSSACKFVLALASAPSAPVAEPACGVTPVTGNTSKAVQATVSGLSAGTEYVYSVVATNAGGTATATPAKAFSTEAEVPAVTAVSPQEGPVAGGTTVTVAGTDLSGATAVEFGVSNPATIVANTATQITVTAPPGAAGAVDVTVTTPGGTSATSAAAEFTYVAASAPDVPSSPDGEPDPGSTSTPPPASPPPTAEAGRLKRPGDAAVSDGRASLLLRCKGPGPCAGKLRLTIGVRGRTVVLGEASYRIAAGRSKTVEVKLSAAARRRLARRGALRVKARAPGLVATIRLELAA